MEVPELCSERCEVEVSWMRCRIELVSECGATKGRCVSFCRGMSSVVSVENSMRNVGKMWAKCGQDRHKAREVEKRVIMKGFRASIEFAHAPVGSVPVNLLLSK